MNPQRWTPFAALAGTGRVVTVVIACLIATALAWSPTALAQDATATVTGVPDPTVRVVHASPDAPAINVLVDGESIVENLSFGSASPFAALSPGDHQLQIVPVDNDAPVIDQTITLEGWTPYILAAVGPLANMQLQNYTVDASETPPGQARLRLINAIPDSPALSLNVAGSDDALAGGIGFPNANDYQGVNAGAYDFEVRNVDSGEVLLTSSQMQIDAGQVYDVFALGAAADSSMQLLPVTTPVDVPCGETLGVGEAVDTCLRVVHASPDSGPVDVYIGETPIVEGIEFGSSTAFVPAANGQQQLRVVAAGTSLDQAVIDTTQDFTSGRAFQITVTGVADDLQATIAGVDLRALPQDQARVRVTHASPDLEAIDVAVAAGPIPFDAIEYRTQSGYVVFDTGAYTFQLRENASDTLLLEAADVQLEPAMVYDIFVIGQSEQGTLQLFILEASANELVGQSATPIAGTPPAGAEAGVAEDVTPVVAVASTPVTVTPGAVTPAATPAQQ